MTRTRLLLHLGLMLGIGAGTAVHAQQKLEDIVHQNPGGVEVIHHAQMVPLSLQDLVARADLVARVLVVEGRAHLTADERQIETDSTVQLLEVLAGSRTVTPAERVVVTTPGGKLDLAGRTLQMHAPDYPSLEDGREYVLFLRPEPGRSVTGVVGGSQGAFVVDDGHVEQVAGEFKESRGKLALAAFKEEILQLTAAK